MKLLFKIIAPLLKFISQWQFSFRDHLIQDDWVELARPKLEVGMVLLSAEKGAFSNWFNRGVWKHAAMYVGGGKIIEATHLGVQLSSFERFCSNKDKICILRPKFCDIIQMNEAVKKAEEWIGWEYDFDFSIHNKAKYCVEVAIESYQGVCPDFSPKKLTIDGESFYTPDLVWEDMKNWTVVLNSADYYREA